MRNIPIATCLLLCGLFLASCLGGDDDDSAESTPGDDHTAESTPGEEGAGEDQERKEGEVEYEAAFAEQPCTMPIPEGQTGASMRCGTLTVPEDREVPEGPTVELAVAILLARDDDAEPDPIVYLHGGPGGAALDLEMQRFTGELANTLQDSRDIVFFDQRGSGRSTPSLQCPEFLDAYTSAVSQSLGVIEQVAATDQALLACRTRLENEGVDLAMYNSAASAADMADLMEELGYEEWNITGAGYGSRVALTALRENPDAIRSLILDSPVPVQANDVDRPATYDRVFNDLLAACKADTACTEGNRRLSRTIEAIVNDWSSNPPTVEAAPGGPGSPVYPIVVTPARFVEILQHALLRTDAIGLIPGAIDAWGRGDYATLESFANAALLDQFLISHGANRAFYCNEEGPFLTTDIISAAQEGLPLEFVLAFAFDPNFCNAWGAPEPDNKENNSVSGETPALILRGELDPLTPERSGRALAQRMENSFLFDFPSTGHLVLFARPECGAQLVSEFLADPESQPEGSCVAAVPAISFQDS
jgi:pimeloyl-ACP methyl ester carboxylesterase